MAELTGQTFAGYEILAKLGQGGMGAVYKARQTILNRLIALKVMAPSLSDDPSFVARFIREASAAANLNHPNMVQVYTAGEHDKTYYIAMEFVEGESLRDRLDRMGRIPPQEAIAITVYVAQALQYAWNKARLIHRDIKPDNVFLSNAGEVKVGDLGLAKSVGGETTELTQTGTAMGSPHYISPEQATGAKEVDFRTDIYSLGCTLYHMLTGQTPYHGDSSMIVMMKHVNDPPPAIFKTWPACPMPLGMLVGKMLAKDRNARPQSYEQLVDDLMAVHEKLKNLESMRAVAVTPTAPQPKTATPTTGAKVVAKSAAPSAVGATVAARPSAKPKSLKTIYAAAGVAAVMALAGLLLWSPWKTSETGSASGSAGILPASSESGSGTAGRMPALPAETAAAPARASAWLPLDIAAACNADVISTAERQSSDQFTFNGGRWASASWLRKNGHPEPGIPDDGRVPLPDTTPPGFFQVRMPPAKNAILISGPEGPYPKPATIELAAGERRACSEIAILHIASSGSGTLRVTLRYETGPETTASLTVIDGGRGRKGPVPDEARVAVVTRDTHPRVGGPSNVFFQQIPSDPQRALHSLTLSFDSLAALRKISETDAQRRFTVGIFAISALPATGAASPAADATTTRQAAPAAAKFGTLFDGRDTSAWQRSDGGPCDWRVEDGALVAGATDLDTREKFQDFDLHIEFACPQDRKQGNSGVYIQGRYELQILESFGKPATDASCGSIFKLKAPAENVSKPPNEWQSFDITFHAARFDAAGAKTANARVSVIHNDRLIHDNAEIPRSTGKGEEENAAPGPIRLQAYGSPVRFRNIRISPLVPATAAASKKTRRVLVFCRCEGFVHKDGIAAANKAFEEMGRKNDAFEVEISSDYEAFDAAKLASYDTVILNNTTKLKIPDDAKKQALLDFVRSGKGLVGIHGATDNFYDDPPLAKLLGGLFDGHPWSANGTWAFKLDDPDHPLCRAFGGKGFKLRDEIYQMKEPYTRADRRVLLSVDLSDPVTANVRGMKRADKDYAVAWIKNEGKGRVFYCGLGHAANVFDEPAVLQFYLDGIRWALGDLEADATPVGAPAAPATSVAPQSAINMLPLIDPQKDAVKGQWTLTGEGVRLEKPELAGVLDLPYAPPEEYDFEIEFTPQSDGRNVNQYLVAAGRSFAWKLNLYGQQPPIHGLDLLDGKLAKNRDEAVVQKPLKLEAGQRYTSKVEVRRGSLRALVNGDEFMRWSGDFNRLSLEPVFKLHDDRHLGVGSVTRAVVFHRIEVREVTGKGTFARGAPAAQTALAAPATVAAATVPATDAGLVLYLNFNEPPSQGIVRDLSGRGNHGRVEGATWVPDGRFGGAMRFDIRQRTQRVRVPNAASLNPQRITIAAWFKSADADQFWNRIADKDYRRGYDLCLGGKEPNKKDWSGHVGAEINGHFAFSDGRVADGQWHHVAGTYDGQVQLLYVDGRLQRPRTRWTGTISANNDDLCIGNTLVNYDSQEFLAFDGLIDEFRIYDRALNSEEIAALVNVSGQTPDATTFDPAALRYGLYLHFDITTFTGYQNMSLVGKAPPSVFAPKALDVRQWARVAREAGATFAVFTAKHEAGFCMWPAKDSDYHVGLSPVKTDIVGEFVAACKAEGLKVGVHYAVPDARIEGQVKFRGPVEPAHFEIIKKHLAELTSRYPDIVVYVVDCAQRLSPEQFSEVTSLLKQSNPQRLILQTPLNERRGRIPSIPGLQEHNAVSVNKNWFWSPNAPLTPVSKLYEEWQNSSRQNFPFLVNIGPNRDGRIPGEYVAVLMELKGMMGGSTQAAPSPASAPGSAQGRRLQWFGYSVCDKPSAVQEIAPYTNFILLRDWEKNTNADAMIEAARKAGLKVVLRLPSKQTWAEMEDTVRPFIAKHRDVIAAACWSVTYHFSDWMPETLAENSRRLKQACPQLQCWAEFVEKPKGKADTLPIPPEVDAILVNFYFDTQPESLRRKVNETFAGWMSKANGRPVLLQWIGQNVPKTTPDTMRTCAEVVREFGCAGLCFHSYDDSINPNGGRKSGIVSSPALVNEIKAIAKESGFVK